MSPWFGCPEPPAVQVVAGMDVENWMPRVDESMDMIGVVMRPVDLSWAGLGGDVQALLPAPVPCARLGVRQQVVWNSVGGDIVGASGTEWQLVTSPMVGAEASMPYGFRLGGYLLPGLRTAVSTQRFVSEVRDLDLQGQHLTLVPTLYAYAVLRFFPQAPVGVHVDTQLPLVTPMRELAWYPYRGLGLGIDVVPDAKWGLPEGW